MFFRQVGIVTGAGTAQGIGRSAALQFAQHGARTVYACDLRMDQLYKLKEQVREAGYITEIVPINMDVTSEDQTRDLCLQVIKESSRLDFFCANAGVVDMRGIWDATVDDYINNFRVMALGPAWAIKYGGRAMAVKSAEKPEAKGSIVVTGSIASISGGVASPAYTAAKHAALGIARRGAIELAKTKIRVNCLAPGVTSTNLWKNSQALGNAPGGETPYVIPVEVSEHDYIQDNSTPEEIAQVMVFLASDLSSAINAQVIVADRGVVHQGKMPWTDQVTIGAIRRPAPLTA